jgi:hypothetical protein
MTANKLFNYYLQATETEVSVQKINQIHELLEPYDTCIILYQYDSILLDMPHHEAKQLLPEIKQLLERGSFPTKVKVGHIYSKMDTISL